MSGGGMGDFPNITGSRCSRARAMHVNKLEADRQRSTADDVPVTLSRRRPAADWKERNPAQQSAKVKDQHQTTSACLPAYTLTYTYTDRTFVYCPHSKHLNILIV